MACSTDQELSVFIPVRQPASTKLGAVTFRGMPTWGCQVGNRALVHFVRPVARSCSSAAAITAAEGLGNKPSSIFCRRRSARHCICSIAMGREPNTLPHAGHCSSLTKSLAMALCPWARDLWACLAFSLVKTRTLSRGHSGHNSTPAGRSAAGYTNNDDDFFFSLRRCASDIVGEKSETVTIAKGREVPVFGTVPGFSCGSHTPNRLLGHRDDAQGFRATHRHTHRRFLD